MPGASAGVEGQPPGPSPQQLLSKIDAGNGGVTAPSCRLAGQSGQRRASPALPALPTCSRSSMPTATATSMPKRTGPDDAQRPCRPSTMDFAQSRGSTDGTASSTAQAGDDLFDKADSDGDGAVSKTELQALLEAMSGGTASQTRVRSDDAFAALDTDGDGSLTQAEFDAGRPPEGSAPPPGAMPHRPAGPGRRRRQDASTTTTTTRLTPTRWRGIADRAAGRCRVDAGAGRLSARCSAPSIPTATRPSASESKTFIDQLTSQFASAAAWRRHGHPSADTELSIRQDRQNRVVTWRGGRPARHRYAQAATTLAAAPALRR